jgi:hypothetical protein
MPVPAIAESQLAAWKEPAFDNEDARAQNTERIIREAIAASAELTALPIKVFAKGSYKNNTNVRRDSDVDIAVEYTGINFSEYGPDADRDTVWQEQGLKPYSGPFRDQQGNTDIGIFKNAVGAALVAAFGESAVNRSNKVFTVRESSRSLAADVVPCTSYRMYITPRRFVDGIRLLPDLPPGHWITNYPHQHYANGVQKNESTSRRFKRIVRILKNLENQMVADGTSPAVASYLIESLVYNCPDACFTASTWAGQVRSALAHIWEDTREPESEKRWMEVNGIKYLFHSYQRWTRDDARRFVHAAWQYVSES